MTLQSTKKPQCLLYSFAMALNIDAADVIGRIGHTGLELVYMEQEGIKRCRSMHIQELIDVSIEYGKAPVCIERNPIIGPSITEAIEPFENNEKRFYDSLRDQVAVLGSYSGPVAHAVAWDGENVFDPRGYVYKLGDRDFEPTIAWILYEIR